MTKETTEYFETEALLASEACLHEHVDYDDNNIPFCLDCGKELPVKDLEVDAD